MAGKLKCLKNIDKLTTKPFLVKGFTTAMLKWFKAAGTPQSGRADCCGLNASAEAAANVRAHEQQAYRKSKWSGTYSRREP